jgi:hypothetical protein
MPCTRTRTREANATKTVAIDVRKPSGVLAGVLGVGALLWATSWAFAPAAPLDTAAPGVRVAAHEVYNPVTAGEALPDGFRQLLPRDGIPPIYDPVFTSATGVDWAAETQVIGVAAGGEAKAYPVSYLDRHEMVNDVIAGDPILVTW